MKNATLRQLKVFETVARRLSFSRAAEELYLTQPAVSTQVKTLEQHAGVALFEQLGKKIFLTPAGAELLQFSRSILRQFQEAEEVMSQFKGVAGGKLNVAVISAGDYLFPHLLVEFARRHVGNVEGPRRQSPGAHRMAPGGDLQREPRQGRQVLSEKGFEGLPRRADPDPQVDRQGQ